MGDGMPDKFLNAIIGNGGFLQQLVIRAANLCGFEKGGSVSHGGGCGRFQSGRIVCGWGCGDITAVGLELELEGDCNMYLTGNAQASHKHCSANDGSSSTGWCHSEKRSRDSDDADQAVIYNDLPLYNLGTRLRCRMSHEEGIPCQCNLSYSSYMMIQLITHKLLHIRLHTDTR